MANEEHGRATLPGFFTEQFNEPVTGIGIKGRGWLVGNDQAWPTNQGAGGGNALLLANR